HITTTPQEQPSRVPGVCSCVSPLIPIDRDSDGQAVPSCNSSPTLWPPCDVIVALVLPIDTLCQDEFAAISLADCVDSPHRNPVECDFATIRQRERYHCPLFFIV